MTIANSLAIYRSIFNACSLNNERNAILLCAVFEITFTYMFICFSFFAWTFSIVIEKMSKLSRIVEGNVNLHPTYLHSLALRILQDNHICTCLQDCDTCHCFDRVYCNNGLLLETRRKSTMNYSKRECGSATKRFTECSTLKSEISLKHTFAVLSCKSRKAGTSVVLQLVVTCSVVLARTIIAMVRH